jgi:hypothetical protein
MNRTYALQSLTLVVLICVAGCSNAPRLPQSSPPLAYGPSCERISVSQQGKEISPDDGLLHIARSPFSIRFNGPETQPAIVLSKDQRLNAFLARHGRKEMWASAGDFVAHHPNDVPIRDEASFFVDEPSRDKFAGLIGADYPQLLRSKVAENPRLDTATFIPKAGGFVASADGRSSLYTVETIDTTPVTEVAMDQLHLTYFATVEKFGPPQKGFFRYPYPLLIKMMWGSCVIAFDRDA